MEITNWKSQNEILRKPGVVRWFIVSTIREKPLLSMVRYPWVCILTPRNRIYRNRTNTFFNFLHTLSRLNIFFCSMNREKGSEKKFLNFPTQCVWFVMKMPKWIFFLFGFCTKKYLYIHFLLIPPENFLFEIPFLFFNPWEEEISLNVRGDINEPQHETIFLHPTARNELNFLLMRWNFLLTAIFAYDFKAFLSCFSQHKPRSD